MQDLNTASKVEEKSGLDSTPQNGDFEVNMIIKQVESEILLQVGVQTKCVSILLVIIIIYQRLCFDWMLVSLRDMYFFLFIYCHVSI